MLLSEQRCPFKNLKHGWKISYKISNHLEGNKTDSITITEIILCLIAFQDMGIKMIKHLS